MALTADYPRSVREAKTLDYPVAASTTIYQGAIVALNTGTGYAVHATDAAARVVVGVAVGQCDNSTGGNGAKSVTVYCNCVMPFTNSTGQPLADTDVGAFAYVEDNGTAAKTTTNYLPLGTVDHLDADGIWVYVPAAKSGMGVPVDLTVGRDLAVTRNATVGGTLGVTGVATFTAAPVLSGGAGVAAGQAVTGAGALTVGVAAGAFNVNVKMGDAAGAQKVSFLDSAANEVARVNSLGDVQNDRDLAVGRNATVGGTLDVTGVSTLASVGVTGAATVGTTLGVTGTLTGASANFSGTVTGGHMKVKYGTAATAGAPTQAEMVLALGAGSDGEVAVFADSTPGVAYLCVFSTVAGGWLYCTGVLGI